MIKGTQKGKLFRDWKSRQTSDETENQKTIRWAQLQSSRNIAAKDSAKDDKQLT